MMESMDTDVCENEELVDQTLEHVRGINKYLRKALKKIESLRKVVEPVRVNNVNNKCVGDKATKSDFILISSGDDSERDDRSGLLQMAAPDDYSMNDTSADKTLNDKTLKLGSSSTSLNYLNHNNSTLVKGNNSDSYSLDGSQRVNTGDIESEDASGEPFIEMFNNNQPFSLFEFNESFQIKMKHQFFRVFIANLPLSVNHKRIKIWLKSNNVEECEDIVINKKNNYSTCILSFSEQSQRDQLLEMNGELFEGAPLKIGPCVEGMDLNFQSK